MDASWTVKKAAAAPKNWCFCTVVLEKTLESPWTARRSSQSILKEISPGVHWKDWCWSWNSSTLATWCQELTHWKRPWCWERLKAGGEGRWDGWRASLTQWTWVWANSRDGEWQGSHAAVHEDAKSQTWLSGWTTIYFFLNHTMEASRIYPIGLVIIASILRENTWTQWQCLQNKCLAAY